MRGNFAGRTCAEGTGGSMKQSYNIPVFIPHEGCPHDCTFCNQRKITGLTTSMTPQRARAEIAEGLSHLKYKEQATIEVAFFGGSFTGLPLAEQEEFLKTAGEFFPQIDGIRVSTRPDYINGNVVVLLKKYGVTTVELGVQSSNEEVLRANRRAHSFQDVKRAAALLKEGGIAVGLQMMVGMWKSNPQRDIQTAQDILALSPDCVRIYPTVTLQNTALECLYRSGEYQPYTLEEAVEVCKEILLMFRQRNIPVIRLGLHAGGDLQTEGCVVAGPFHPAFGELTESRIYRDEIERKITLDGIKDAALTVFCHPSAVSKAVGHKGSNKKYLKEKYGVDIKVIADTTAPLDKIRF